MNIEQHEHRIQEIIAATCKEMGVRLFAAVKTSEDGRIEFHNTYDTKSEVHAERRRAVFSLAASSALLGAASAAWMTTSSIWSLLALIVSSGLVGWFIPSSADALRKDPPSSAELHARIARALAADGYLVRVIDGAFQVTWA